MRAPAQRPATSGARRRLAFARLSTALAFALLACAARSQETPRRLTVLHTNDLHARLLPDAHDRGGFARLAGAIRRESASADGVLVLDAGDLVQGGPVSSVFRGVPIYEIANLLGLDVSTLGNHEFDYGWKTIVEFREAALFPIVSANVVGEGGKLLADAPLAVREINGVRVAGVGLLTADLPHLVVPSNIGPWRVEPVVETLRRVVPGIAAEADLVVALGHLSEDEEDAILAEVPEVSVVVSGHSHSGLAHPKRAGERVLVRVRSGGRELGRLDLEVDPARNSLVASRWKAIPIDASTPEAEDVAARVAHWEAKVASVADVRVGRSAREMSRAEVEDLVERIMVRHTGADLAYLASGEIRDILPAGELRARHVWNVMPFEDRVVVVELKGSALPREIVAGRSIDPGRLYTVAVTDFTAELGREFRGKAPSGADASPLLRDLIIAWIRERGTLE
jgi:2',3'-cyclic-nucleotide 2'-phosphodiesterase (5'-nucleotidase family)